MTWKSPVTSPSRKVARVDFIFDGFDEGDQVSGRGWAKIEEEQLVGQIIFHMSDESGFKASKGK